MKPSFVALAALTLGVLAASLVDTAIPTEITSIRSIAVTLSNSAASMVTHTVGASIGVSSIKPSCLKMELVLEFPYLKTGLFYHYTSIKLVYENVS